MSSQESQDYIVDLLLDEDTIRKSKEPKISFKSTINFDYITMDVVKLFKSIFENWKSELTKINTKPIKIEPLLKIISESKEILLIIATDYISVSRLFTTISNLKYTVTKINHELLQYDNVFSYIASNYQISICTREMFNVLKFRYKLPFEKFIHYDGYLDLEFSDKSFYFIESDIDFVQPKLDFIQIQENHSKYKRNFQEFVQKDQSNIEFQPEKKRNIENLPIGLDKNFLKFEEEKKPNNNLIVVKCNDTTKVSLVNLYSQKIFGKSITVDFKQEGPNIYYCKVYVDGFKYFGIGRSPTKKIAKEEAAWELLKDIKKDYNIQI